MSNARSDELIELRLRPTTSLARELNVSRQWSRLSVVPASQHGAELKRMRKAFPQREYQHDARYINPHAASLTHHHFSPRTVLLGEVLDMTTVLGELATTWDREVHGWAMLTDERAEQMKPGVAALYLARLKPTGETPAPSDAGDETYQMWHKRAADSDFVLNVPDFCGYYIGTVSRIGYRSDKWESRGETHDYDHLFAESGAEPEAWADAPDLANATGVVVRGGDMRVTPAGID